jgi:hypothetical protein
VGICHRDFFPQDRPEGRLPHLYCSFNIWQHILCVYPSMLPQIIPGMVKVWMDVDN